MYTIHIFSIPSVCLSICDNTLKKNIKLFKTYKATPEQSESIIHTNTTTTTKTPA